MIDGSPRCCGDSNFGVNELCEKQQTEINCCNTVEEDDYIEIPNEYKMRKKNERKKQWPQNQLHRQFITQTMRKASEDRWGQLKRGYLKRTTEALIMAAQQQATRTNNIKAKIDKTQENSKCRRCGKAEECVNQVLSEYTKIALKE